MIYSRNAVFTAVQADILAAHSGTYVTSRFTDKPASFPSVLIREIDRTRPVQNIQLDFADVQWESVFEVQVVSAKVNTAASEAYSIMNTVRNAFNNLFYYEYSEVPIDGGDTFTVIGRFRRIIGGGDTMPTKSN